MWLIQHHLYKIKRGGNHIFVWLVRPQTGERRSVESQISSPMSYFLFLFYVKNKSCYYSREVNGKLVLIIGPSGVGKSVILKELKKMHPEFHFPRSATTRQKREGEGDQLYKFLSDDEFDQLISSEKVLESAVVHEGARYGTLAEEIIPYIEEGKIVIREVDVQGFDSIRKHKLFSGDSPEYLLQSIFILPENKDQLVARIKGRAPISDEELNRRIESMDKELEHAELCDVKIKNVQGKLKDTVQKIEEVL
jgi:guanylate kinase